MTISFTCHKIYQNIYCSPDLLNSVHEFNKFDNCLNYAYSWLINYSKLSKSDKVIIGVSTDKQLCTNMDIIKENTVIDTEILNKLNNLYNKDLSPTYYY